MEEGGGKRWMGGMSKRKRRRGKETYRIEVSSGSVSSGISSPTDPPRVLLLGVEKNPIMVDGIR